MKESFTPSAADSNPVSFRRWQSRADSNTLRPGLGRRSAASPDRVLSRAGAPGGPSRHGRPVAMVGGAVGAGSTGLASTRWGDRFIFGISVELTQAQIRFILLQVGKSCQQSVVEKDATTTTARQASIGQRLGYDFAGKTQVANSTWRRQERAGGGKDRRHRPDGRGAQREGSRPSRASSCAARMTSIPSVPGPRATAANSDWPQPLGGARRPQSLFMKATAMKMFRKSVEGPDRCEFER